MKKHKIAIAIGISLGVFGLYLFSVLRPNHHAHSLATNVQSDQTQAVASNAAQVPAPAGPIANEPRVQEPSTGDAENRGGIPKASPEILALYNMTLDQDDGPHTIYFNGEKPPEEPVAVGLSQEQREAAVELTASRETVELMQAFEGEEEKADPDRGVSLDHGVVR